MMLKKTSRRFEILKMINQEPFCSTELNEKFGLAKENSTMSRTLQSFFEEGFMYRFKVPNAGYRKAYFYSLTHAGKFLLKNWEN